MRHDEWTRALGIEHPIIQAPLGGVATDDLVAAVSNAGGLGSLGAAYQTPQQIAESIRRIRALTPRPFGVNLFAPNARSFARATDARRMLALLAPVHERLGLPAPQVPPRPADPFGAQLEVVLDARPAVFSFTFGIPPADALARLRQRGIAVWGTATTVDEARLLHQAGADAVIAQGAEAGGHRGTFHGPLEAGLVPTVELTAAIARAVPVPIVASGGIMDGADVARVLAAGAVAAGLGTAFLACPECGASPPYKQALLAARADTTTLTSAFSGRLARGLRNAFVELTAREQDAVLEFPIQNALTRPMRTAAAQKGEAGFLSLWAGQGVARLRAMPAGELVGAIAAELAQHAP
jgi:nitronate monooxygenase